MTWLAILERLVTAIEVWSLFATLFGTSGAKPQLPRPLELAQRET